MSQSRIPPTERSLDAERIWREGEDLLDQLERGKLNGDQLDQTRGFDELVVRLRTICGARLTTIGRTHRDSEGRFQIESLGRSGVCVATTDPVDANFEIDPSLHWIVEPEGKGKGEICRTTQSLTSNDYVFIEQRFDDSVALNVRKPVAELQHALTGLAIPILLRSELIAARDRASECEQLFSGGSPTESYHAIAATVARVSGAPRATLVLQRGSSLRVVGSSAAAKIDQDARTIRSIKRVVSNDADKSEYMSTFGILDLRVVDLQACDGGSDGGSFAYVVLEWFADSIESDERAEPEVALSKLAVALPMVSRATMLAMRREESTAGLIQRMRTSLSPAFLAALLATFIVACAILCWLPVPFSIAVKGKVEPVGFASVYAPDQGLISEVFVEDGERVVEGTPLMQLTSPALELVDQDTRSRLAAAQTKLSSTVASKRDSHSFATAEAEVLKAEINGLKQQLKIISKQRDRLLLRSPIVGVVDQWDTRNSMVGRPVTHGHHLMDLVNENDGWRVKLEVPDHEIGYLSDSSKATNRTRSCSFRVLSSPTISHIGKLSEIASASKINEQGESVVEVTLEVDAQSAESLRPGAGVIARVPCDERSVAFVLFRGFVEWWRTLVWI
ncbi:HlyD family efflux transporter periplasmic adaptor subunit [Rubripirellula amarantea]|nr:HlyD family efflux transporter periplasmic adaptor subunit [Rubripirellula amarantea]